MSDIFSWSDSVEIAIKRAKKRDSGALGAVEGILGMEPTSTAAKYLSCHSAASQARTRYQHTRQSRGKPALPAGTTGNQGWDHILNNLLRQKVAA